MQTWSEKIKLRETLWYVSRLIMKCIAFTKENNDKGYYNKI